MNDRRTPKDYRPHLRTSCGKCEQCLKLRAERCHAIVGKALFRPLVDGVAPDPQPLKLARGTGGATFFALVTPTELYRQWLDSVRGRVGALVRGPWAYIRSAVPAEELRAWYDADVSPIDAARRIVEAFAFLRSFEAPLV